MLKICSKRYKVDNQPVVYKVYGDFHTHTTYSGHAMASPEEMVRGAKDKDLNFIALTDHVYEYTTRHDFENQKVRPKFFSKWLSDSTIRVIGGRELNLFTNNSTRFSAGLNLCAWHSWFGPKPEKVLHTDALNNHLFLMDTTHILCHPERTAILFCTEKAHDFLNGLCQMAVDAQEEYNRPFYIEINTTSGSVGHYDDSVSMEHLSYQEYLMYILAIQYPTLPIILGSDAHCTKDICCNFGFYLDRLNGHDLLDRVVNLNVDKCQEIVDLSNT